MEENLKKRILQAQQGNKDVLNELVLENKGLIINVARKFENRGYEFDDLYQIGAIGFIKAVQKFDFSYNVMLSTFAVTYIIGEIKRFLRDNGPIKISRQIKEISKKIALEQRNNPNITIEELAKMFNVDKEEIVVALEANRKLESIDEEAYDEDSGGESKISKIASNKDESNNLIDKICIKELIAELKTREKQIIILRYYKDKTQTEVAKMLGITQVQVSRIEKKILLEMRRKIA